jgi:ABC-type uncharacterized transport system auxiliary subunit
MTTCRRLVMPAPFLGALLVLGACAQAPVPNDTFYRLEVSDPEATGGTGMPLDAVVEVRPFDADGILGERALVYVESPQGSLHQYSYHFWVEPPTQAIQRELTEHLRGTGYFAQVLTPRFRERSDVKVQGRIGRLEQVLGSSGAASVVVELEIGAERTVRGGGLLVLNTYRVEAPASDASPAAAALAKRAALREVFERFTEDLRLALAGLPRG